jgi:hypothetical protein
MKLFWIILLFPIALFAQIGGVGTYTPNGPDGGQFQGFNPRNVTVLSPQNGDISKIIGTSPPVGRTYLLSPGIYNCYGPMAAPTNGAIIGSGWSTVLVNLYTNTPFDRPYPIIAATDNSFVQDLVITNFYLGTGPDIYQASWGAHSDVSKAFTNATLRNCLLFGGSDAVYVRASNSCSGNIYSCTITSRWDANVFFDAAHKFSFFDCVIAGGQTRAGKGIAVQQANGTVIKCYNTRFFGSSFAGTESISLFDTDPNEVAECYNCYFTNNVSNWIWADCGSGASLRFYGCNIASTNVSDGGNGETTVQYYPPTVDGIIFKGTSEGGQGPTLTSSFPNTNDLILSAPAAFKTSYTVIKSNTLANIPPLSPGDICTYSSNGVAFRILVSPSGTRTTNTW